MPQHVGGDPVISKAAAAAVSSARWNPCDRMGAPRAPVNTRASGSFPATSDQVVDQKWGIGTSRRSWPLVGPHAGMRGMDGNQGRMSPHCLTHGNR